MTAYNISKHTIWIGMVFTFVQIVIAGEGSYLGNNKMLISTCFGLPGIILLVTGLVMDNKLKPNSPISKLEKILAIGLLIGSVIMISLALLGTIMIRNLLQYVP